MPKSYSTDLLEKVIKFIKQNNMDFSLAEAVFEIHSTTIRRWHKMSLKGSIKDPEPKERKPKKLDPEKLKAFVEQNPDLTIKEIANHFGVWFQAVFYRLKKLNSYQPKDMVFIDESGFDHQMVKERGWSLRGKKIIGEKSGSAHGRTSVIAGLCQKKVLAHFYFNGHTNTEVFSTWLEDVLFPELKEGQVVVMDNASFHSKTRILEILKKQNCEVLFMAPYSPALNLIEHYWAWCKNKIRKIWKSNKSFYEKLEYVLPAEYSISN